MAKDFEASEGLNRKGCCDSLEMSAMSIEGKNEVNGRHSCLPYPRI